MSLTSLAAGGLPSCVFATTDLPLCHKGWTELYLETGREQTLQPDLVINDIGDIAQVPDLELNEAVLTLENKIIEALRPRLPLGRRAQCILGFPGRSKTDPLYALRLLDKARALTGQPGYLTVYDQDDHEFTRRYYEETLVEAAHLTTERFLSGDCDTPHTLIAKWGLREGAIEYVRPQLGHLAIALMPGRHYDLVTAFFRTVLVRGGVAIWAHDSWAEYGDWQTLHSDMMAAIQRDFDLLVDPIVPSPYKTPFSTRFPRNEAMLLQKKA